MSSPVRSPQNTWTERLKSRPKEPSESSWQLRILAQLLVIVGIIATDTAAETTLSFWAIPASVVGATWSWHNRDKPNIAVKFLLAIGMMISLALFFRNLLFGGQLNDTRVALTSLLVQIQMLHSFDLPRRKDLGYSMIIGLILISVACTLSQTMTFGLWLLLFLAIALPVLVLDYRSRLGLKRWRWFEPAPAQPKRRLAGLPIVFLAIVGLGLLIFAVMPRLPSYQIQTFPMSAPIDQSGKFEPERVTNPGYIGQGKGSGVRSGRGKSPETGKGEIDASFYYGFGSKINQNLRGNMTAKVVMRVRSQAEGFWRVMAFDRYNGQGWEISRNAETETLKRSAFSYQFYPPLAVKLNRTKRVVQTYTMVSDLPNVIPAMDEPREVYFPTQEIAVDRENGLRSPVPLTEGLTYTVISEVPYVDRAVLQTAQSTYRRNISDPNSGNPYSEVNPALKLKLQTLATTLLAQANIPITSDYEKALFLAQSVKQHYTLQTDLPFLESQDDLVDAFFFKYHGGYPDHFATALTMLLRSVGLSTRLVTGFGPGQFNPFTGYYVVKNTDAYAMTEVYFHKYGWFSFDPIPGHSLTPPSVAESQTFTALKAFWQWIAGWLPSPVTGWLNWAVGGLFTLLGEAIGRFLGLFRQGAWGWLLGIAAAIGGSFLLWLSWAGYQRWRYWRRLRRLEPTARLYQQLTDWLAHQGLPKHPAQTPWEYARIVANRGFLRGDRTPQIITNAYLAWRYGGQTPDLVELQQSFRLLKIRQQRQWFQQLPQLTARRVRLRYRRWRRN